MFFNSFSTESPNIYLFQLLKPDISLISFRFVSSMVHTKKQFIAGFSLFMGFVENRSQSSPEPELDSPPLLTQPSTEPSVVQQTDHQSVNDLDPGTRSQSHIKKVCPNSVNPEAPCSTSRLCSCVCFMSLNVCE